MAYIIRRAWAERLSGACCLWYCQSETPPEIYSMQASRQGEWKALWPANLHSLSFSQCQHSSSPHTYKPTHINKSKGFACNTAITRRAERWQARETWRRGRRGWRNSGGACSIMTKERKGRKGCAYKTGKRRKNRKKWSKVRDEKWRLTRENCSPFSCQSDQILPPSVSHLSLIWVYWRDFSLSLTDHKWGQ